VARCLVAAGRVEKSDSSHTPGQATTTGQSVTDSSKNGETSATGNAAVEVVHQLSTDLSKAMEELYIQYFSQELPKVNYNSFERWLCHCFRNSVKSKVVCVLLQHVSLQLVSFFIGDQIFCRACNSKCKSVSNRGSGLLQVQCLLKFETVSRL